MVGTLVSPWGWKKVGIEITDDKKAPSQAAGAIRHDHFANN